MHVVEINVSGLAGFLLTKTAAAYSRRTLKDWYDLAFVLLHNDQGGPAAAAAAVRERFGDELVGSIRTALDDLAANFESPSTQGPGAYATQMVVDHPELDGTFLLADAVPRRRGVPGRGIQRALITANIATSFPFIQSSRVLTLGRLPAAPHVAD